MYIYIHIYTYTYIYVHTYTYSYPSTYIYVYVYIHIARLCKFSIPEFVYSELPRPVPSEKSHKTPRYVKRKLPQTREYTVKYVVIPDDCALWYCVGYD